MGVQHDLFVQLAPELDDVGERVEPRRVGEDLLRHHRRPLGGKAHAADVVHLYQGLADLAQLLRAQVVGVAAGDDDVLQLGARGDIGKRPLPALLADVQVDLVDELSIDAHRVAAGAEAAVHRAGIKGQKQRLVRVAVGQAGHRGVGHLAQRVEAELWVIRQ